MTPTLLLWFKVGLFAYIIYTLYTIFRTFKKRGYFIPKHRKEWGSLISDLLFFVLSIFLWFILHNNYEKPMDAVMSFKNKPLPTISYIDVQTHQLTTLTNKGTIILNIWATWCPPCRKEMPELDAVQKTVDSTVKIIALSDEDILTIEQFQQKHPYRFTIGVFSSSNSLLNSIETRPVSILLIDGNVKDIVVGARGESFFKEWSNRH